MSIRKVEFWLKVPLPLLRLRQRIARALDRRFMRACWVEMWAWGNGDRKLRQALRPEPRCAQEAARDGACWCGKNRATPDPFGQTTRVPTPGR